MDAGAVAARLTSSAVMPIVKKLIVKEGPGAGLVDKPVRLSTLLTFTGEKRTLSDRDVHKLAEELVARAVQASGPHEPPLPPDEQLSVADALARSLLALGALNMADVQAVRLGHAELAGMVASQGKRRTDVRHLSADGLALYHSVLETACLHILHFFTQRSTFVARTLVEQSRQLQELVAKVDVLIERTPARSAEDARFEAKYARYIAQKHSQITIYGLDLTEVAEWPLDVAYLSLEATAPAHTAQQWMSLDQSRGTYAIDSTAVHAPVPQPVDQALSGNGRVLLRGVAGSGKTTLVQWLAVTTARQKEVTGRHAHLLGRVPFVLPLRTLTRGGAQLPSPKEFLAAISCPLDDQQPSGWAGRVLESGRGLLLVDGIDEVPEEERQRTRHWLGDLLTAFPDNLCLVTSRPSAVREEWLGQQEFTELTLSRMSREDITLFIQRWHQAANADRELESDLLEAVRRKPDLNRLATNPLMCGLICALHRERRGYLPRGRKALYDAALSMLLERRDRQRQMGRPQGIELDTETQRELLQKLAYSLIKNGRSEMDERDALRLLGQVLPAVRHAAEQGSTEDIYRYLLNRSGLLRQPSQHTVDFVHRTFQDYLGACAAVEECDYDLLATHAHLDQWEDVVRMAVAHGRADERARLLRLLLERGDADEEHRNRLHLLALACLEQATKLDPEVREEVERRAADLIPPRDVDEARELAELGPVVLELLPGPDGLEQDEALATAHAAAQIGGDAALPLLKKYRRHEDAGVRAQLGRAWDRFDTTTYTEEIISHLVDKGDTQITVRKETELEALRALPGHSDVHLRGDFTPHQITNALDGTALDFLTLASNTEVRDLDFLRQFPHLAYLDLLGCPNIRDLSALSSLPLTHLWLWHLPQLPRDCGLELLTTLEFLFFRDDTAWPGFDGLPQAAPLKKLGLPAVASDLAGIAAFEELELVDLFRGHHVLTPRDWEALASLPRLSEVAVQAELTPPLASIVEFPMAEVSRLMLSCEVREAHTLRALVEALPLLFPVLEDIHLSFITTELDLLPLAELPHLNKVTLANCGPLRNADRLPDTVELNRVPRPREHPGHTG